MEATMQVASGDRVKQIHVSDIRHVQFRGSNLLVLQTCFQDGLTAVVASSNVTDVTHRISD
jgi:hypothetical protein